MTRKLRALVGSLDFVLSMHDLEKRVQRLDALILCRIGERVSSSNRIDRFKPFLEFLEMKIPIVDVRVASNVREKVEHVMLEVINVILPIVRRVFLA